MPAHNRRNKSLNFSCHQKVNPTITTSLKEKENIPTTPRSQTHQKLYHIVNPRKTITPYTNRNHINKENLISLINQSTNRVDSRMRFSHHSLNKRDQINYKIQTMFEASIIQRVDSAMSTEGDKVKYSLSQLNKVNSLEKEINELRITLKNKDDSLNKLQRTNDELQLEITRYRQQLECQVKIENQVIELDSYCQQLLAQNESLKQKVSQNNETLFSHLVKDMFGKCRQIEQSSHLLASVFQKITKLTIMLYNREELPMEMFAQRIRKDIVQGQDSNLLSPVDDRLGILECHHKINEIISFIGYAQQSMLKKGEKTLQQLSSKLITNISETYNTFSQF